MKKKDYRLSKLKHQLNARKMNGEKTVIWSLNREQTEFVENTLHYRTEPYIFSIKTRAFSKKLRAKYSIIRDLHFAHVKRKPKITRKLKKSDRKILDLNGVEYFCIKKTIYLQESET